MAPLTGRGSLRPNQSGPHSYVFLALLLMVVVLAFNYWSSSSKNNDLLEQLSSFQRKHKVCYDEVVTLRKASVNVENGLETARKESSELMSQINKLQVMGKDYIEQIDSCGRNISQMKTHYKDLIDKANLECERQVEESRSRAETSCSKEKDDVMKDLERAKKEQKQQLQQQQQKEQQLQLTIDQQEEELNKMRAEQEQQRQTKQYEEDRLKRQEDHKREHTKRDRIQKQGEGQQKDTWSQKQGEGQYRDGENRKQGEGQQKDSWSQKQGEGQQKDTWSQKQGEGQQKDSENRKQGEGQQRDGEIQKQGEGQQRNGDNQKQGEGQQRNGENLKQGEGQQRDGEIQKQGEGQQRNGENLKQGEGQQRNGENLKQGEGQQRDGEIQKQGEGQQRDGENQKQGEGQQKDSWNQKQVDGHPKDQPVLKETGSEQNSDLKQDGQGRIKLTDSREKKESEDTSQNSDHSTAVPVHGDSARERNDTRMVQSTDADGTPANGLASPESQQPKDPKSQNANTTWVLQPPEAKYSQPLKFGTDHAPGLRPAHWIDRARRPDELQEQMQHGIPGIQSAGAFAGKRENESSTQVNKTESLEGQRGISTNVEDASKQQERKIGKPGQREVAGSPGQLGDITNLKDENQENIEMTGEEGKEIVKQNIETPGVSQTESQDNEGQEGKEH